MHLVSESEFCKLHRYLEHMHHHHKGIHFIFQPATLITFKHKANVSTFFSEDSQTLT